MAIFFRFVQPLLPQSSHVTAPKYKFDVAAPHLRGRQISTTFYKNIYQLQAQGLRFDRDRRERPAAADVDHTVKRRWAQAQLCISCTDGTVLRASFAGALSRRHGGWPPAQPAGQAGGLRGWLPGIASSLLFWRC